MNKQQSIPFSYIFLLPQFSTDIWLRVSRVPATYGMHCYTFLICSFSDMLYVSILFFLVKIIF